ncbi:hypothetical protein [Nocardiopsis sp. MG754419]|uniref:hypothetical protein n=1 Tax=Nocardiopsis sp. MG754419 TaxID=2259865 RepID=UPI001BAC0336|nr:hypothetical protein [Nocardiopsis sp. MG754419]MBR8743265.1 hypothetical protein [Nocardiopsis sp. MG754419]
MVELLIKLKFALDRHTPSGTRWLTLALVVGGAALTWYLALNAASDAVRSSLLTLLFTLWAGVWMFAPTLTNGAGVLRPQYFTLLPLDRNRVGVGLLATMFVGVGPVMTLVAMGALVWHSWSADPATLFLGLLGTLALVVFIVSLSRLVFRALGAAMRTRVGMEIASLQWGLIVAGLFFGWVAIQPAIAATDELAARGVEGTAASVLAVLPTSWPVLAVDAAAAGSWGAAFGWLGAFVLLTVVTVVITGRLLAPSVAVRGMRQRSRPWGSRVLEHRGSWLPDTPLGAVIGKELRSWWRDPWRGFELRSALWAGLFVGVLGLISYLPQIAPFAGVIALLIMGMGASNMYGHDGTALWMTVLGQGEDTVRADVRGRQVAVAVLLVPASALLSTVMVFATGEFWAVPYVVAALIAFAGVSNGLSVLLSVVAVAPGTDPHKRVDANDTGDHSFQSWVSLVAIPLLSSPTLLTAAVTMTAGASWVTVPVALLNGGLVAWLLGSLTIRHLERRLPEVFARIRYGGEVAVRSAPAPEGTMLERIERGTLERERESASHE